MIEFQKDLNQAKLDSIELKLMNTTFYIAVSNSEVLNWKSEITSWLRQFEKMISRFLKNNELWRLNEANCNQELTLSPLLYDILLKAEKYRIKTGGRFSPYMLKQLEAHGYNRSFPFNTAPEKLIMPIKENEEDPFIFHHDSRITKKTNAKIDLGGIAKGYAVEATAGWLKKYAKSKYGIVDGGGDITVWSNGEKTWTIGVMDPFEDDKEIGVFSIQNGGIATSNTIHRSWVQGKTKKHHLLDGRTGMPIENTIVQATVVTQNCLDAEIGAKICFMNDGLPVKSILSILSNSFNYVLVNSNGQLEMR